MWSLSWQKESAVFISPQNEFQTTAWRRGITDCQNAILRHLLHKLVIRVGTLSCLSIDANQAPDRPIHTLNIKFSLNEQSHDAGA
tara:strand:+ start:37 stop:291 length:255 start_codon:yes stop_codon:yes gene_type:complete